MAEGKAAKSLDRAVRALLVAADQRCPAIIGQAHLIHHGGRAAPDEIARRLAELKRDAADLAAAIAAVEAALHAPPRPPALHRPGPGESRAERRLDPQKILQCLLTCNASHDIKAHTPKLRPPSDIDPEGSMRPRGPS